MSLETPVEKSFFVECWGNRVFHMDKFPRKLNHIAGDDKTTSAS